jgi:di/tricarboxylate transporter
MRDRRFWFILLVLGGFVMFAQRASVAQSAIPIRQTANLDWQGLVTIVVFVLVLIALIRELFSPDIVMLGGASVLVITGVISPHQFLIGFSRPIIFTLAMLFIVVSAIQAKGILTLLARFALPKKGGYRVRLAKIMLPITAVSAFLNNTPIVLMVTASIRRWAVERGESPSRYLMPVSIAAIFGGMCTLIGTAGNLVVDGLMREVNPASGFTFFELALVGIPCLVIGYLYLLTFGASLIPDRPDPAASAQAERRQFTAEFRVLPDSSLMGKSVSDVGRRYLHGEYLIEIRRSGVVIEAPSHDELIVEGDRLVFAGDVEQIAKVHAIPGLQSLADPKFELDVTSPHVAEVVVAVNSWLIGKTVRRANFRTYYGASVVAIYREGKRVGGSIGDTVLRAGDTLILLSNRPWTVTHHYAADFYPIKQAEEVPLFVPSRAAFVVAVLAAMVTAVVLGVPILISSLCAAGLLLVSRSVSLRQARSAVDWHLLLLVASAFGLGSALYSTGVALVIAKGVMVIVGYNPYLLIGGLFLLTMVFTEMITNTAAALMVFPIAMETVRVAGYDSLTAIKTVGVTIAIAASSSFLTPIGYQTNTIVYGPGGYRFADYARVGWGLSLTQLAAGTLLIPIIWPLVA